MKQGAAGASCKSCRTPKAAVHSLVVLHDVRLCSQQLELVEILLPNIAENNTSA